MIWRPMIDTPIVLHLFPIKQPSADSSISCYFSLVNICSCPMISTNFTKEDVRDRLPSKDTEEQDEEDWTIFEV